MKNNKIAISPLDSFEGYAKLKSKLGELQTKLSDVEKQYQEARTKRINQQLGDTQAAERIARLTGEETSAVSEHLSPLPALTAEAIDLRAAIKVIESKLAYERVAVSRQICERAEPEYRRRVAAICSVLVDLNARMADYTSMVNELQSNDIAFVSYLPPMSVRFVDRANDRNGQIAHYLRQAVENKVIDRSMIPAELK